MTELWRSAVAIAALCAATGCSGANAKTGSSSTGGDTSGDGKTGPDNSADAADCPHAKLDDVWLDKQLGCVSVGELVSPKVASAPGDREDRAFIVSQQTLDQGFTNVLGSGNSRSFKYFVCVHDAPSDLTSASGTVPFATDLVLAFQVGAANPAVGSSTLSVGGALETPCDPAAHPLILNGDGTVDSINPAAVDALEISDKH